MFEVEGSAMIQWSVVEIQGERRELGHHAIRFSGVDKIVSQLLHLPF